jgi:hypothetical protein
VDVRTLAFLFEKCQKITKQENENEQDKKQLETSRVRRGAVRLVRDVFVTLETSIDAYAQYELVVVVLVHVIVVEHEIRNHT